jgi:hypothetical protein
VISLQVTEAPQALVNRVAPAASALAIPAGTPVTVRTIDAVDSRRSAPGEKFRATVEEPLEAGGQVVVPKGAPASLQLTKVDHAGALKGKEAVSLRLQEITIADRPRSVVTSYARLESPGKGKKSLVKTATIGAAGAAVGAIAGGGAGALIGAGVGGAAGLAVSAAGKSRVKIKPETRLVFVLRTPVPVEDPRKILPASGDQEPVKP